MDENPVQGLGFINRLKNRLSQVNQRTAFDAFIVLLILIGLAASVYLAGQRQIFRSRASQEGNVEILDKDGNPPPKDEQGNPVVETPQIRIKIDFPTEWNTQGFVPSSLFSPAYAAESAQCLNQTETFCRGITCINANYYDDSTKAFIRDGNVAGCYQCSPSCSSSTAPQPTQAPAPTAVPTQPPAQQTCPGQCASPINQSSAVTINGSTCSSYLGNSAYDQDCVRRNTGYNWCYTSCAQPTAVPTRPPATAQPTATAAPVQACGGRWEGKKTTCSADANLDKAGCTYLGAWSDPKSPVCGTTTPFCWACPESAFNAPVQPTVTPQRTFLPAVGGGPPPTANPVREQTEWIRISLNEANVLNGNCYNETTKTGTGSTDPRQHCMEFSTTDLIARGGLVNWGLPNQPGLHTIYIGFVSNKGNLKPNPLQIKVTYRPKQAAPMPTAIPLDPFDVKALTNATNVSCAGGTAFYEQPGIESTEIPGYYCSCISNAYVSLQPNTSESSPITTKSLCFDQAKDKYPWCYQNYYVSCLISSGGTDNNLKCQRIFGNCITIKGGTIKGKIKIFTDGTTYGGILLSVIPAIKDIDGTIKLDEKNSQEIKSFEFNYPPPTNENQEINYTLNLLTSYDYYLLAPRYTDSDGKVKATLHLVNIDCPDSIFYGINKSDSSRYPIGCIVKIGSTQNLSLKIGTP